MHIYEFLRKDFCIMDLKSQDKERAIREIILDLPEGDKIIDKQKFIQDILERERRGSTGIGHNVAIPHCSCTGVDGFMIAFARSKTGIDFNSLDGDKVNLIFLMGTNPQELNLYLTLLAKLSKLLIQESFRKELMAAKDSEDVVEIFKKYET